MPFGAGNRAARAGVIEAFTDRRVCASGRPSATSTAGSARRYRATAAAWEQYAQALRART
jgi:hypothetical protein